MQRFILLLLVVACGERGRAQAAPLRENPVPAQARTETEPEPDVNAFQHMVRRSVVSVRAQVLSVATEALQTDGTRHVETYDVLEVFHQATGSSVSVGDDIRVDLARHVHPANKAVPGEEVVLFLAGPFEYVVGAGVTQSWYRLAAWPTSDVAEFDDSQARWFKLSYTGRGEYVGAWGRLSLVDETRLDLGSYDMCCDDSTEVDANGKTRPASSVINDRALTWPEFLTMIRAAAAAEGS